MKFAILLLIGNLVPMALIALAAWMISNGTPGYGWVIAGAALLAVSPTTKKVN